MTQQILFLTIGLAIFGGASSSAQPIDADQLLDASIAYHDPNNQWFQGAWELVFKESRPGGADRETLVVIDNVNDRFRYRTQRDDNVIEGSLPDGSGETCTILFNGSSEITEEIKEQYRLTCDRVVWYRDYYSYLWGLPMKLRDPGTIIDPKIIETTYDDQAVLGLKVTYEEPVGGDTWYYYFDPRSYALVGYRFYHDETKNDGEYITLEGETESADLRLPDNRGWFMHIDEKYLGTDSLETLTKISVPDAGMAENSTGR